MLMNNIIRKHTVNINNYLKQKESRLVALENSIIFRHNFQA